MAMASLLSGQSIGGVSQSEPITNDEIAERQRLKWLNTLKRKGVREFIIDGHPIMARNYKNALRKYNNLKK